MLHWVLIGDMRILRLGRIEWSVSWVVGGFGNGMRWMQTGAHIIQEQDGGSWAELRTL